MNNSFTFRFWGAVLAAGILTGVCPADELKIGSPAPDFKVVTWVKGNEVKKLEKGKIYVIEFWATWCGPCRVSIPHLTEMAKKFKDKATFIGVDSFEQPADNLDEVKKFVADMGDKMDYNVAVDGSAAFMAKNWMIAAGQTGIPTAFVVDKDGVIAWVGHPMMMEDNLAEIVAGTYDMKAAIQKQEDDKKAQAEAAKAQKEEEAMMAKLAPHFNKLEKLVGGGDFKGAVAEMDAMIKEEPACEKQLAAKKFEFMARLGDPGTNAYAKRLFEKGIIKDDALSLNQVAWFMVDDDVNLKGADYALAVKIAERAVELSKGREAATMDTLGYAYFKNKQVDKAIETQEKAVKLCDTDPTVDDATREELKDRLSKFKKAKGGG